MSEKLSNLPALPSPITTGDNLYVIRGGISYKADNTDLPSGSGGTVDSITAGDGIQVDSTNPAIPIVTADMTLQEVLDSGNSATSPDTNSSHQVNLVNNASTINTYVVNTGVSEVEVNFTPSIWYAFQRDIADDKDAQFRIQNAIASIQQENSGGTAKTTFLCTEPIANATVKVPAPSAGTYNLAHSVDGVEADSTGDIKTEYHLSFAFGGEDEDLAVATGAITFQMPNFATTLTGVSVNVKTAPTGTAATFDLNEGGVSVLSTKINIDATETTSETALVQPVISDSALAANAVMTLDIDAIGTTIAGAGGKAWIYYTRT